MAIVRLKEPCPSAPKIKVVFLGPAGSGKTNTVNGIAGDEFSGNYISTIGANFKTAILAEQGTTAEAKPSNPIHFELWDTAGQDRFRSLTSTYLRGVQLAVFQVDGTEGLAAADREYMVGHAGQDLERLPFVYRDPSALLDPSEVRPPRVPRILVINKVIKGHREEEAKPDDPKNADKPIRAGETRLTSGEIERLRIDLGVEPEDVFYTSVQAGLLHSLTSAMYRKTKPIAYPAPEVIAGPVDYQAIKKVFEEAKALLVEPGETSLESKPSEVFICPLTSSSGRDFKNCLGRLKDTILDAFEKDKFENPRQALGIALAAKELARKVAVCTVDITDINNFHDFVYPQVKVISRVGRFIGGLIGAALGVFIGAMVGAFAPPAGAFAALALGKAGAVAGAAVGGLVVGYLGSKFTLWGHSASRLERAAEEVGRSVAEDKKAPAQPQRPAI